MKTWSPEHIRPTWRGRSAALGERVALRCGDAINRPDVVIAVPVCNESQRITACVEALQVTLAERPRSGVVLLVNNSSDGSALKALLALSERGMTAVVIDILLEPSRATAGWARRLALDVAARWAGPDAVLMTTDADGRVAPDWAEANLALLAKGANLVCGRIAPDAVEAATLPEGLDDAYAIEAVFTALSIELDARLDPRPHDPWPHHGLASGASLAISARDYRRVGRMPPLLCSEDRAFAALVERHDLCVRHSDAPLVTVSCRRHGRARGGMADAIAARIADPDSPADQRLLPAATTALRAAFRCATRKAWAAGDDIDHLMRQLGVTEAHAVRARRATTFGAVWAKIEAGSQALVARRMKPSDLARELPYLRRLVTLARASR